MPLIFPYRVLQKDDVLDPIELNADIQPVKTLIGGALDMINIKGITADGFKSRAIPDKEAYYKYHTGTKITVDPPGFEDGAPLGRGDRGVAHPTFSQTDLGGVFMLSNTNTWEAVTSTSVTIQTGQANLWINCWLQYFVNGWKFGSANFFEDDDPVTAANPSYLGIHHHSNGFWASRAQFAIRVDGRVLDWTITGKQDLFSRSPVAIQPVHTLVKTDKVNDKNLPGSRVPDTRAVTPGPEVCPIRLGTLYPVMAGSHTIELVARRLPKRKNITARNSDRVGIHSREIHVIEMPIHAIQSTAMPTRDEPTFVFREESPVTDRTMGKTVKNLEYQSNNLLEGNIKREALFNTQLPSKVVQAWQKAIDNQYLTWKCAPHWPGTQLTDVTNDPLGWGWYHVRAKGVGVSDDFLEIDIPTTPGMFLDDDIIIVMANIGLIEVGVRGGKAPVFHAQRFLDTFGAFRFGLRDNLTSTGVEDWQLSSGVSGPGSSAYINSHNWANPTFGFNALESMGIGASSNDLARFFGENTKENTDIPLFTVLRGSDFNKSASRNYIGVFCASMSVVEGGPGTGPSYDKGGAVTLRNPYLAWDRANLMMIHLRK
tara:strand:+ start:5049 stop:6842 length:1794 start_codon:yes stop_codon:yes gene_type:complete